MSTQQQAAPLPRADPSNTAGAVNNTNTDINGTKPTANSNAPTTTNANPPPPHPSINSLSDAARTAQAFFDAARAFTASAGFHGTAELIDEVPRLQKIVHEKEKEARTLAAALGEQQRAHAASLAEEKHERERIGEAFLDTYNREYDKHRREARELKEKVEALEQEVRRGKEDVARLHKSDEELVRQGQKVRGMLEAEKERCEKAGKMIAELKKRGEERAEAARKEAERKGVEMAELAARLKRAEGEAAKAKSSMLAVHRENEELQKDLEEATERLGELEGFAEPLSDDKWENSISLLDELWRSAHDLISSYFRKDLPKEILANTYAWSEIKKPEDFSHNIPLPQSNSLCAKSMRIAVILAILARLIDKYLFQPSYILHEESGLREILIRQAIENSKREAFTRGIFLATFEDEQADIADELVTRIVKELMHHIHDLLPAAHVEGFRGRLEQIVQDARDIWWKAQRLRLRLEPDFQVEDYGWERPIQFQFDHHPLHNGLPPVTPKKQQANNKVDTPQQSPGSKTAATASPQTPVKTPTTGSSAAITPGMPAPTTITAPSIPAPTLLSNTNGHMQSLAPADESLLLIFPRIYIVEDDDPEPVTPGTVLLRSQADDAERELFLQQQQNYANNGLPSVGRAASHRGSGGGGGGGYAGNGVVRVGGPRPRRLSVPLMEEIPEVPTPAEEGKGAPVGSAGPPPLVGDGGGGGSTATTTTTAADSDKKDFLGQRAAVGGGG